MRDQLSSGGGTLPAVREQAGALAGPLHDCYFEFRIHFADTGQARAFRRRMGFLSPRCALRAEPDAVVWVGFRAWARDTEDAHTQAALATRVAAVRARVRHVPVVIEGGAARSLGPVRAVDLKRAHAERAELLAHLSDPIPAMLRSLDPSATEAADTVRRLGRPAPSGPSQPPPTRVPPAAASTPRRWRHR